jgi:cytochrome b involved in lipid metabolism
MAIVGLSLLAVSLSVLAFKYRHPFWQRICGSQGAATAHATSKDGGHIGAASQEKMKSLPADKKIQLDSATNQTPDADLDSPDSTPKAKATQIYPQISVPEFSLTNENEDDRHDAPKHSNSSDTPLIEKNIVVSTPTVSILQQPSKKEQSSSQLSMLPPSIPLPRSTISSTAQASQIRTAGPLPNRGPPSSRSGNSLSLPSSLAPPTLNSRNKVALAPGRSSIDWAQLTRTSKDLSGVPYLQRVTPSQLKQMNGRKGRPVWASYYGKVYNLTPYVPYHPGGEGEIMRAAGKNAEKLFNDIHAYVNWENMLGQCCVGIMITENERQANGQNDWEAMD